MSGMYGGVVLSPARKPDGHCSCGKSLYGNYGICDECREWFAEGNSKIAVCRNCGVSFISYRRAFGCCTVECREQVGLREYHSRQAQERFIKGWTIMGLDVLQQVFRELYPAPLIVEAEAPRQQPLWNALFAPLDALKPARRQSKMEVRPPWRDNLCNAHTQRDLCDEFEDQVERQWDHEQNRRPT